MPDGPARRHLLGGSTVGVTSAALGANASALGRQRRGDLAIGVASVSSPV